MAEALAGAGADVVCAASRAGGARETIEAVRRLGREGIEVVADLGDRDAVRRLAEQVDALGRIDILVNNAGGFVRRVPLAEASDAIIDEVFRQNARSMIVLGRSVIPLMRSQGGGSIINVTSQAARSGGSTGAGVYASTKGFVSTYTRALAKELCLDGIRVNAVSPGVIDTPIHRDHTDPALLETLRAGIPMQRLGRADECAGAFLFLASECLSSYITGQIIEVNGGSVMP
jgi:3-oxoacyl-[acyl-carrier protein] reductase